MVAGHSPSITGPPDEPPGRVAAAPETWHASPGQRDCYPARAGGPWLCSTLVRSGFHAVVVPSRFKTRVQPQR